MKIYSFLTCQKLVVLFDGDGEETITFAKPLNEGFFIAKRWWPRGFYKVILFEDGTTMRDEKGANYVKRWKFFS